MGAMSELMIDKMNADREAQAKKKKPQRNDPCGCGSGLKFKNCCEIQIRLGLQKRVIDARAKQRQKS
jgi:hypothetical protein